MSVWVPERSVPTRIRAANTVMRYSNEALDARRGGLAADRWVAIIDDHRSVRSCLVRVMRLEGIRAEVFASAEEYLDHPTRTAPSCLVLDMQLPGMSGYTLAQLLERDRPPLPPIIFISALDEKALLRLPHRAEPPRYLQKPFDSRVLVGLVRQHLEAEAVSKAG